MRTTRTTRAVMFLIGILGSAQARGRMGMPGGRSLGGYGASTIGSYYGGGGGYVPFGGRSGLIPEARNPGFQPVPRRPTSTPIGGASSPSFSGRGGAGMGARRGRGSEGMGLGQEGSVGMPMTGRGGSRRVSPGPGLGWPFAVPAGFGGSGSMNSP
jgi:hypothetical protein